MLFKDIPKPVRKYITEGIRKAFKYSHVVHDLKKAKRVEKPRFKKDGNLSLQKDVSHLCNWCKQPFKKGLHIDHVIPIVEMHKTLEDYTLHEYYVRTMTNPLQFLCKPCHNKKTGIEKGIRSDLKEMQGKLNKASIKRKQMNREQREKYDNLKDYVADLRVAIELTENCLEYTMVDEYRDLYKRSIISYKEKFEAAKKALEQGPKDEV